MKSEFEKWLGDVWLSDAEWDESKNTYSDSRIHCMWSAWQHQQSKIDELQAKFDQHDQWLGNRNKDVQELNNIIAKHVTEKDELQKRVDDLTQVVEELLEEMKYPTATFEEVICSGVRELEQVLKGGSDE